MNWFSVDTQGLGQLLGRRGKAFVLYELLQNALDTGATDVALNLKPIDGRPAARLQVIDNDPDGFKDLAHAYTLFAPSEKKADAELRGRFNIGEKLVLALATEAQIISTQGGVRFDGDGRHALRRRRDAGTEFVATIRMTRAELDDAVGEFRRVIIPAGVHVVFNGDTLANQKPLRSVKASLTTEIADEEGILRRRVRETTIDIHRAVGAPAWLYEMGIPVCETGDRYHADIQQKVPLNMDRDGVTPAYLRAVRVAVLNAMADSIETADTSAPWVRDATADDRCERRSVERVMDLQFGRQRVILDPSDREANRIATSRGYTVIPGNALNKAQWENVRRFGAALPSGQVTPSPKSYEKDGDPLKVVPHGEWTSEERAVAQYIECVGWRVIDRSVSVRIANEPNWNVLATYGDGQVTLNQGGLDEDWWTDITRINEILIHELAHEYGGHLTAKFDDGLGTIGARLTDLALKQPKLFRLTDSV